MNLLAPDELTVTVSFTEEVHNSKVQWNCAATWKVFNVFNNVGNLAILNLLPPNSALNLIICVQTYNQMILYTSIHSNH